MDKEKIISELVIYEFQRASKLFPPFHSDHESYAVLLEEVEEMKLESDLTMSYLNDIWHNIRFNNKEYIPKNLDKARQSAYRTICEAIQVLTMIEKYKIYLEVSGGKSDGL